MTKDVVDTEVAVAAAAEALWAEIGGDGRYDFEEVTRLARAAVQAATDALGIVDLSTVQRSLHINRRQHADPPAVTTVTVSPQEDYL